MSETPPSNTSGIMIAIWNDDVSEEEKAEAQLELNALVAQIADLSKRLADKTEEVSWVRRKVGISADAPIGHLQGKLHVWENNSAVIGGYVQGLDERAAQIADLSKRLAERSGWQKCATHGEINADHAWGCPDCVSELRTEMKSVREQLAAVETENYGLRQDETALE